MDESMHQSPDTPECAIPYRLSSAIHQESTSISRPYYPVNQVWLCIIHFILNNKTKRNNIELETWSVCQLNELLSELEWRVQHHSETLIAELALRDELEYEKELKNTFISLLLNVQNKRRQMTANQKKPASNAATTASATTPTGKNANKTGFTQSDSKVSPFVQLSRIPSRLGWLYWFMTASGGRKRTRSVKGLSNIFNLVNHFQEANRESYIPAIFKGFSFIKLHFLSTYLVYFVKLNYSNFHFHLPIVVHNDSYTVSPWQRTPKQSNRSGPN